MKHGLLIAEAPLAAEHELQGAQASVVALHVESSWIGDQTCVPCIGRWVPNHWTTRVVQLCFLLIEKLVCICWKCFEKYRKRKKFSHYSIFDTASCIFSNSSPTFFFLWMYTDLKKKKKTCLGLYSASYFSIQAELWNQDSGQDFIPMPERKRRPMLPQLFCARSPAPARVAGCRHLTFGCSVSLAGAHFYTNFSLASQAHWP